MGAFLEQAVQYPIAEQVRDLVPVPYRVQALQRHVVGVVAGLPGRDGLAERGVAKGDRRVRICS